MPNLKVVSLPAKPKRRKPPRIKAEMLVVLRSGGPIMVVRKIEEETAHCHFFDDEQDFALHKIPISLLDPFDGEVEFYVSGADKHQVALPKPWKRK